MPTANERQHGGDHYRKHGGEYQHWDWVADVKLGYHAGCASKYAYRYNDKGVPEQDLEKAIHYVDKCEELGITGSSVTHRATKFWKFVLTNEVPLTDAPALWYIMEGQWHEARQCLEGLKEGLARQS